MEINKKNSQSFLDKFRGRTNKIDKNGINNALNPQTDDSTNQKQEIRGSRKRKLVSLDIINELKDQQKLKVNLDELIPSNLQKKFHYPLLQLAKRSTKTKLIANKIEYLPPLSSPLKALDKKKQNDMSLVLPPSRSTSEHSQNLHKRVFGKYLKLDDEAMRHYQFLQQIDRKRRVYRKDSALNSER